MTVGPGGSVVLVVLKVVDVRSKATTLALPLPTNSVLLSGLNTSPSGADSGFTPLARAAQHCAPGKPPNRLLAPNPGIWKLSVRHPKRVQFPLDETNGGMTSPASSVAQELALTPPPATPLAPAKKLTARSSCVSTTTTSRPIRSDTKNRWLVESTTLRSKELN